MGFELVHGQVAVPLSLVYETVVYQEAEIQQLPITKTQDRKKEGGAGSEETGSGGKVLEGQEELTEVFGAQEELAEICRELQQTLDELDETRRQLKVAEETIAAKEQEVARLGWEVQKEKQRYKQL